MRVTLIASTALVPANNLPEGPPYETDQWLSDGEGSYWADAADWLAEFAGRACYESWHRPNPQTACNDAYIRNIVQKQHFSVLEHASATFYVEGVPRSLTHELVRHRHLSVSQRSQRYVDEASSEWHIPNVVQRISDGPTREQVIAEIDAINDRAREFYRVIQLRLAEVGITGKKAREAARCVLPNATHTALVVTGNHRAWREVIQKRWHVAADADIRALAGMLLRELKSIAPNIYHDLDSDRPIGMPPEVAYDQTAKGVQWP